MRYYSYSSDKWEHKWDTNLSRTFRQPANAIGGGCLFILHSTSFVRFLFSFFSHWSISAVISVGILSVVFPRYSHVFVTWREHGLPFPLIRSYPLLFPCPFSSIMFLSLPFLLRLYCPLVFIHYSHVFVTCRRIRSALFSYPLSFSRPFLQNAVLASRDGGPFGPRLTAVAL